MLPPVAINENPPALNAAPLLAAPASTVTLGLPVDGIVVGHENDFRAASDCECTQKVINKF